MADIRKSAFVKGGAHDERTNEQSRSMFREGFGNGKIAGRTFGIADFLNNYELLVDQMAAIDPLPNLIPLTPFPDPYAEERRRSTGIDDNDVARWPCEFKRIKRTTQDRFPRQRDWMHQWSERMYSVGECGGTTKK